MFAADGPSFVASNNSGGGQKTYRCSGHTGGCKAQVRAYKGADGVWEVHTVDAAHTHRSGGNTKGRTAALQHLASAAVKDHSLRLSSLPGCWVLSATCFNSSALVLSRKPRNTQTAPSSDVSSFIVLGCAAHVVAESPLKVLCVDAGHLEGRLERYDAGRDGHGRRQEAGARGDQHLRQGEH
ncbi:unnamed protein product [Ectocarpus sp. 6 AP-2014]